jgi:hypothetical protein
MEVPIYDENGYLKPHQIIQLDLSTLEEMFTYNSHRKELFDVFKDYLLKLNSTLIAPFQLWVDGSFITKKEMPNDIDLVTFINSNEYERWRNRIWGFKEIYKFQGLDLHFVCVFPNNDRRRIETDYSTNDYHRLFNYDRKNIKKGFIQLKFPLT